MKRIFTFGLMLTSLFALTNCTEELVDPTIPTDEMTQENVTPEEEGIPFQIYASLETETKTVGSEVDGTLKTTWEAGDKINVFHSVAGTSNAYVDDGLFTIADIAKGLFNGTIKEGSIDPSKSYDWFFVYIEDANGPVDLTDIKAIPMTFSVNAKTSVSEVSGVNCPMYGTIRNLSGAVTPRMQLQHMASLIELTIKNNTGAKDYHSYWNWQGGDITLTDVRLSSSSALTNSSLTADITGSSIAFTANDTGSKELTAVSSATSVIKGGSSKFYFIVSPSTSKSHTLNFWINGLSRSVTKTLAFEAGKVTKFTVPINDLKHPHTSGALDKESTGAENATGGKLMLDLGSAVESETSQQPNASINGQPGVPYYIVGTDGSQGNMILRGTVKDLINSIDAGFYAASWPGKRAAMTISHMQLYIDGVRFAEHEDFQDGMQTILHEALWYLGDVAWSLFKRQILKQITPGIPRDPTDGMLVNLTQFIDPTTITFNGLVECGASADKTQIILLNEEYFYKGITADLIDYFLNDDSPNTTGGKFIYNNIKPTFQGLYDAVNNNTSELDTKNNNGKTYAENTIDAIYGKLESVLATKTFAIGSYITLEFKHMFTALFPTKDELKNKLPNMEVELTISTCPYHSNKAQGYGSKANPIPLNSISGTVYPIVFWGLNAN